MSVDRIADLQLFVDAAQLGSLSAAARKHGLSPAAASATLQRLEAALQVRLFHRSTRMLRLSVEGERYLAYCRRALDLLAEASASLHDGSDQVAGRLRISAPSDLGRNVLLDLLGQFQALHPALELTLMLSDATASLVEEGIDLAVRYGKPADSSLVARPLAYSRRAVCVAPSLLATLDAPLHPRALATLPTLVLVSPSGPMNDWHYRDDHGHGVVRVSAQGETNDGEVLRKWALQGRGFAYKSLLDIEGDVAACRLVMVLDDYFREPAPLHLLYHRTAYQPARMAQLIEFLLARFAERRT